MKRLKIENGAIVVEASIYMPLVLCTVMALLYLALFNMQEYMLMYHAQKIASVVSREEAYLGYEEFKMGENNEADFSWGEGNVPSAAVVTSYYTAHHHRMSDLYREIGRGLPIGEESDYSSRFSGAVRESALIALGNISSPEVQIDRGFLGTDINVTIAHGIPVPGALKYLGYGGNTTLRVAAYSYSVNPSEFVRNVDLAVDLISYIMDKLEMSKDYHAFLDQVDKTLSKIL